MISLTLLTLALAPFVAAQATTQQVEGIEANFQQAGLTGSGNTALLASFSPSALLSLNFAGVGDIDVGKALTKDQVATQPTVTLSPSDASNKFPGNYTIIMVDADIVGTDETGGVNHHWLANFVTVANNQVTNGTVQAPVTAYAGPGPAAGSGPHRYVVLLYVQPDTFVQPQEFQKPLGVAKFSLTDYVKSSGLGALVGANYFTVEEGTATVTPSATSAVNSATLAAGSGSPSGTVIKGGPSATPSGTSGSNGSSRVEISFGMVLALVTLFTVLA